MPSRKSSSVAARSASGGSARDLNGSAGLWIATAADAFFIAAGFAAGAGDYVISGAASGMGAWEAATAFPTEAVCAAMAGGGSDRDPAFGFVRAIAQTTTAAATKRA